MAGGLDSLLSLLGNIGNAAGIQGDNPSGQNFLQRVEVNNPNVQANSLSALASNPNFQSADPATQQQIIAQATGKAPPVVNTAMANITKNPNFMNGTPQQKYGALNAITPDPSYALMAAQPNPNGGLPWQTSQSQSQQNQPSKGIDSGTAINNTLALEGGMSKDGKSAFGIDAKANPDEFAKIKNLHQTKGDDAAKAEAGSFLKTNYYDPHSADIEALPAGQGQIVFDSFVNHTPAVANQILGAAKAGASSQQLLAMRQDEYNKLAASDADKPANQQQYAPNLPGWNNRLTQLGQQVSQFGQPQPPAGYPPIPFRGGQIPAANQNAPQQPSAQLPQDLQTQLDFARTLAASPSGQVRADAIVKAVQADPRYDATKAAQTSGNTYVMSANKVPIQPGAPNSNTSENTLESSNTAVQPLPNAKDGKPILPGITSAPINKARVPNYNFPDTETGVHDRNTWFDEDTKANQAMGANLDSVQTEKFRIQQLANIYKDVQAGTLTAQNPDFFNRLQAIGIDASPDKMKDLGNIQAAMQNHIFQILSQYKDVNTNGESSPSRLFSGVINTLMEEGENPGKQPQSLFKVLAQAQALTDRKIDMVQSWNGAGGLGNRLIDNKYTMRPDDFQQLFETSHDLDTYEKAAEKEIGPLKGMPGNTENGRINIIDPKGNRGTIDKGHLQSLLDSGGKLDQ
jgi:hypothetical protein